MSRPARSREPARQRLWRPVLRSGRDRGRRRLSGVHLLALLVLSVIAAAARADDPCAAFSWDVAHERTLFATRATALAAGTALSSSPSLATDRLYQLTLGLQQAISFEAPPAKMRMAEGAYAGLAKLRVDVGGRYRISLDQPFWLDVVAGGALVRSSDFQGRPGCSAPHKVVEFVLPADTALTLQFSGAASPTLKVTVTRSPAP